MTLRFAAARRRFLTRLLGIAGAATLSGCDRLSESRWFPRVLDSAELLNRRVQRPLAGRNTLAQEFSESDLSPVFPANGSRDPVDPDYRLLAADGFRAWRLEIGGLVEKPMRLSLDEVRNLPSRTQITRHDCVEGWSAIAKWKGASLGALLNAVQPKARARYVVCYCFDTMDASGAKYYESISFADAYHPQTILAYEWNDQVLPIAYGAPLRLRVERQLGYKMAKYLHRIELVEDFGHIGAGKGGYWEDQGYAWYAGI